DGAAKGSVESAAHGHGEAELLIFGLVIAPLGKMRKLAEAPLRQEFFPQSRCCDVVSDPSSSKHDLRERCEAMRGEWRPARPHGEHGRISALVLRHIDDQAAIHFAYDLQRRIDSSRPLSTGADATSSAQEALVDGVGIQLYGRFFRRWPFHGLVHRGPLFGGVGSKGGAD